MEYLLLLVGFVLLIKGADFFVDGSSDIAKLLKIPSVVIGLTIVALGTSAPEAAVSITAGFAGNNDMALGNVIGSNIFNVAVVAGVCAVIMPYVVDEIIFKRDLPICIGITALLAIFMYDGQIALWEAITLLVLFAGYIFMTVIHAMKHRTQEKTEEENTRKPIISVLFIIGGLAAVIFGGQLVVDNASKIAVSLGMSQRLVALTIVAIGTSPPELVTSIVAAKKGDSGLAMGNVVGSNIFNILFILGSSATLHPIAVASDAMIDVIVCFAIAVFAFIAVAISKKKLNRIAGVILLLAYVAYTLFIILR